MLKCNLHNSKVKFFRSLNGILGKLGSNPNIATTLYLISTFCNPVLFYGLEALKLSKAEINQMAYPFNSVYMKLFTTFDNSIVTLCQFYAGYLPLSYMLDLRTFNFYLDLSVNICTPANLLYYWFGRDERDALALKYDIVDSMNSNSIKFMIYQSFIKSVNL